MLEHGFTRTDCVVAVGGGVVGDLAGFAAASFMRGIDFYNIPTTVLSQVDSSVGGKVAIDLDNIKNCVGAFHQPRRVLIDPDVLRTLPKRQISNGLAEAVKMSLTSDAELFAVFEAGRALGLSYGATMFRIVIPQAIKNILPTLGNEFIALVKDTSVVGFIATLDITQAFKRIGSQNYEFIIPYLLLAAIYLVIVLIITGIVKLLERRLSKSDRRN
jgi:3-dehydroquinate synthetase